MSDDLQIDASEEKQGGSSWKLYLWVVLALLLFGGGAVFYHFSAGNALRYWVTKSGEEVVVRKGIFFPMGSVRLEGAPAYASVQVPAETTFESSPVESLEEVDDILFGLLTEQARLALKERDQAGVDRAREYLRRARMLGSIGEKEEELLLSLKGDMDMARGQASLRNIVPILERALKDIHRAQTRGTQMEQSPQDWVLWIETRLEEFKAVVKTMRPPREFSLSRSYPYPTPSPKDATATGTQTPPAGRGEGPGDTRHPEPNLHEPARSAPVPPAARMPSPTPIAPATGRVGTPEGLQPPAPPAGTTAPRRAVEPPARPRPGNPQRAPEPGSETL